MQLPHWLTAHLEHRVAHLEKIMALNFANVQAAVAALVADVQKVLPLVNVNANEPAEQAAIDAVTKSLSDLDAAVKAVIPAAPAPAPSA